MDNFEFSSNAGKKQHLATIGNAWLQIGLMEPRTETLLHIKKESIYIWGDFDT